MATNDPRSETDKDRTRGSQTGGRGLDEGRYPNMKAQQELEHAQHVARGLKMGLTRKQAETHARQDEAEGDRADMARGQARAGRDRSA